MKCRLILPLFLAAVLLFIALSVGSPVFLMPAVLILLLVLLSLISVLVTARTLRTEVRMDRDRVCRGEDVRLKVTVRCGSLLPVAPVTVVLHTTPEAPEAVLRLERANGSLQSTRTVFHAGHAGACRPGVACCIVEDLFGMFSQTVKPQDISRELLVLPQTFEVDDLTYAPGDSGMEAMARATEDITSPSDVRSYAPGDPMKKIHWKLSLRKRELLVRRFEEPALPDALVLMDCSAPRALTMEAVADLRDAMLETAASLMEHPHEGHQVRLPLMGSHPTQLLSSMGMPMILEELARLDFSETDAFQRVLMMESRRLNRVGCVVILVTWLNGDLVDAIARIHRMGPAVRVYLITSAPEEPGMLRYIARLQQTAVEVSYITPMPA